MRNAIPTPRYSIRRAFTLIELLVVISIIGILMGLLLPAVQKIRQSAKRAQAASEINQLSTACDTFKDAFGFYPPNTFTVPTTKNTGNVNFQILQSMYPRWMLTAANGAGTGLAAGTYNGGQSMVYFLGGPTTTGWDNAGPTAPVAAASSKKGPFFDFPANRLGGGYFLDPWGQPYRYVGVDFTTKKYPTGAVDGVTAYSRGSGTSLKYENDSKCQIFSSGPGKTFATGGSWTPGSGQWGGYNSPGTDDLANFNGGYQLGSIP